MENEEEKLQGVLNNAGQTPAMDEMSKAAPQPSLPTSMPGLPSAAGIPPAAARMPMMAKPPEGAFKGQPRPQYKDYGADRNSDFTRDLQSFKKYGAYGLEVKPSWKMGEIMKMRDAVMNGASAKDIKAMFPNRTEAAIRYQVRNLFGGFKKQGPPDLGGQSGRRLREQRQREEDIKLLRDYMEKIHGKQSLNESMNDIHPSIIEMLS